MAKVDDSMQHSLLLISVCISSGILSPYFAFAAAKFLSIMGELSQCVAINFGQ